MPLRRDCRRNRHCRGRLVSVVTGGYEAESLRPVRRRSPGTARRTLLRGNLARLQRSPDRADDRSVERVARLPQDSTVSWPELSPEEVIAALERIVARNRRKGSGANHPDDILPPPPEHLITSELGTFTRRRRLSSRRAAAKNQLLLRSVPTCVGLTRSRSTSTVRGASGTPVDDVVA